MKHQPNRLAAETPHAFAGASIDRATPLKFRLNGRVIPGFVGDSVLSAVIASGITGAGHRDGHPLALSARFAPAIMLAGSDAALPMDRVPAVDGAEFRTLPNPVAGRISAALDMLGLGGQSLGLDLDRPGTMALPWLDAPAEDEQTTDVVVIGGGIAGMSAALAAANDGRRVVLVEASPVLGGHARLFGTLEGEETPDHSIARLGVEVLATESITVLTRARAIAVRPGSVRVHAVSIEGNRPSARLIDYRAPAIVVATGTIERLPYFPGNRLPGVVGAMEAFEDAYRYGIWRGHSTLITTVSSPGYRLAMLAGDAGIAVHRIIDGRPHPQSRFIEFAKAYGITQSPGTLAARAVWQGRKGLVITPQMAFAGLVRAEEPIAADSLVACGGWQPDLSLWHMAGGQSAWNAEHSRLEPRDGPEGIALAGSAAGYLSSRACLQSGEDAVRELLDQHRVAVTEHLIDPIYETPDDPSPIADATDAADAPAYLDAGTSLVARPAEPKRRFLSYRRPAPWSLASHPMAFEIDDVAAAVQLGLLPATGAGTVAQERSMLHAGLISSHRSPRPEATTPPLCPDFLVGRFGPDATLWTVIPAEPRLLEVGAPIFVNSDQTDPRDAVGVVLKAAPDKAIALIGKQNASPGEGATLREQGRPVAIRLGEPYRGD